MSAENEKHAGAGDSPPSLDEKVAGDSEPHIEKLADGPEAGSGCQHGLSSALSTSVDRLRTGAYRSDYSII